MTTYYSRSGFYADIIRPIGSLFSGTVFLDGVENYVFNETETTIYFSNEGTYTFEFENATETDPTSFIIYDFDTGVEIVSLTFPLNSELILVTGIDGESDQSLLIEYPLETFNYVNPGVLVTWVCALIEPAQGGSLEDTVADLPEPKIVGNLTLCSNEEWKGDETASPSCSSGLSGELYLFSIRNKSTDELLYSRIECCCPTVIPDETPSPGFVCTCPDWGRATSYNQTLFSSSVRLREWVLSNAGAKADCKHIMAAKRIMGIEQPIYSDPPYSAPPGPPTPG